MYDLLDNSPIGLSIVSSETKVRIFTNRQLVTMFGAKSVDDLQARRIRDSWVDLERFHEAERTLAEGRNLVNFRAERYRLDGSKWWVLMNSHFMVFDGVPARAVWHSDITEMVETGSALEKINSELEARVQERTRELQQTQERFRGYAEIASDWFWEMDSDLKYTFVSDSYVKFSGRSPAGLIGRSRREMYRGQFPDQRKTWMAFLDTLDAHQDFENFTYSYRRSDDSVRVMSNNGRAIFSDDGTFMGYRGVGSDITDQHVLQERFNNNQAQLVAFTENSPSPVTIVDAEGRYTLVNDIVCKTMGMTADQILGKTASEIFSPQIATTLNHQFNTVLELGKAQQFEFSANDVDGNLLTFLTERFPIYSAGGMLLGVGGVNTDITERKKIEEALHDSETSFQMIVDMQSDLITRFSPDWDLTFVNRAYCEFVNRTEEEVIGTSMFIDVPEAEKSKLIDYFLTFTPDTPLQQNENQLQRHDGELRDMEWSNLAQFDETGQIIGYQSVGRDVTDRKRAERALKSSESRYQSVVDGQSELITRFTPDGKFTFVNAAYCRLIGRSHSEIMNSTVFQDVAPEEVPRLQAYFASFHTDMPNRTIENRLRRYDGEFRDIEWHDKAFFDSTGRVTEFQSVARDVTEQRKAQNEIIQANEKAQEANRAKSSFLSTMSHEIRTPHNGVLGLAQLLMDTELGTDQRRSVETILSSGQTLLAILNDVLDMSKIEAGELQLEETVFRVSELVSMVTLPFQNLVTEKGLTLEVTDQTDPGLTVRGDPVRLRQVLWNLLSNAIKFTQKGKVHLTVNDAGKTSEAVADGRDCILAFRIQDTGIGIRPDRLDAIFDAFTQQDSSITRQFGGTGLGLSIVRQLTDLMGGTVRVNSDPQTGTAFTVTLPFYEASETEAENHAPSGQGTVNPENGPLKVLLVEDNSVNAMIAKSFLEKMGHQVEHAENGRIAVTMAQKGWADLILMDVHMPVMDGIEATKLIRASHEIGSVPIVGLTADAFGDRHTYFRSVGMNDVLTKPYSIQQLAHKLSEYLPNRNPADAPQPGASDPGAADLPVGSGLPPSAIGDDQGFDSFSRQMSPEIMATLLEQAEQSLHVRMSELVAGVSASDTKKIREAAHSIKGSSGSMFASRLSALAADMEEKSEDLDAVRMLLVEMEGARDETLNWWTSKRSPGP